MRDKYDWRYYTNENGDTPKPGERKPFLWNTAVIRIDLRNHMFYGDLDQNRIDILKKDTENKSNRMDIVLYNERDEPIYLIHNGRVYNIPEKPTDL